MPSTVKITHLGFRGSTNQTSLTQKPVYVKTPDEAWEYYRSISTVPKGTLDRCTVAYGRLPVPATPGQQKFFDEIYGWVGSKEFNNSEPPTLPLIELPPKQSRSCIDSKPTYVWHRKNLSISMNPYHVSKVVERFRESVTFAERQVNSYTSIVTGGPMSYYGRGLPNGGGGSYGDSFDSHWLIEFEFDYWIKVSEVPGRNALYLPPKVSTDIPDLYDLVYTDLLAKASRADYDLATEIAELSESLSTLVELGPKLIASLKSLRQAAAKVPAWWFSKQGRRKMRDLLRRGKNLPDAVAEYWLLYRYGLMPLYYSIEDIRKALARKEAKFVTERNGENRADTALWVSPNGESRERFGYTILTNGVWKARDLDVASKKVQVYLPVALWEITPWSFVVDWFLNVGDWIQSFRVIPAAEARHCISTRVKTTWELYAEQKPKEVVTVVTNKTLRLPSGSLILKGTERQLRAPLRVLLCDRTEDRFTRSISQGTRSLSTNVNLNLKRALDSLALLWLLR